MESFLMGLRMIVLCIVPVISIFPNQKITIVGAGYVGLTSGCVLASMGHTVTCVDICPKKVEALTRGDTPVYEPNLAEMILDNITQNRLFFSTDTDAAIRDGDVIIVTVGTPMNETGQVDLAALNKVTASIGSNLNDYKIICIKSTVPPGTCENVKRALHQQCGHDNFDVVSNPEFLREGCALSDFFLKNPIVLGSDSEKALHAMEALYATLLARGRTLITTNFVTSELIKYAWNAFSAIKISYVDELARLCNTMHADIKTLTYGMSFSDELLPIRNIVPGPGIGGSCLIKDTRAISFLAQHHGIDFEVLNAFMNCDHQHKRHLYRDFCTLMDNEPIGKTVSILGLSFKANTDDIRYAPARKFIKNLLAAGAKVKAYDPKAMHNMQVLYPEVVYCDTADQAITGADALILLTDWDEFRTLDLAHVARLMKQPVIMDTRNIWSPALLRNAGFTFKNLGMLS